MGRAPSVSVPTSPRTSLITSNGGPCRLGLTSGMCQGADEWSDVDHQNMPMCPQQQSEADVISGIGDSNNRTGPREVGPKQHTVISRGKPKS